MYVFRHLIVVSLLEERRKNQYNNFHKKQRMLNFVNFSNFKQGEKVSL